MIGRNRFLARKAISTIVLGAVIAIIVFVAAVGAYVVILNQSGGGTNKTSSSSTPSSTTSSSASTTATSTSSSTTSTSTTTTSSSFTTSSSTTSTITSTASTCTQTTSTGPNQNSTLEQQVLPLIQNFSKVSLRESSVANGSLSNINSSYVVTSKPGSGSQYYVLNLTEMVSTQFENGTVSYKIWLLSNGTVDKIVSNNSTLTGPYADFEYLALFGPYDLVAIGGSILSQQGINSSDYTVINQTAVSLGNVHVNQTDYQFTQAYINSQNYCSSLVLSDLLIGTGTVSGTNMPLGLLFYEVADSAVTSLTVDLQVVSLTKAA